MEQKNKGYHKIFESLCRKKNIHTNVLFVENGDGSISYHNGFGGRNIDSPMLLASITKLFTTTCILKLIESKAINLEDSIAVYLDQNVIQGLHCYKGKDYSNNLNIANLLYQTSGLPDPLEADKMSIIKTVLKKDSEYTFKESLAVTKANKPHFIPGTKAYYANINFDLLGLIIEKVTKLSLSQAYQKFICLPLHLKNTYLPTSNADIIPEGYYKDITLYRPKLIASSYASGGCISTPRELMVFLKAFFKGELFNIDSLYNANEYKKVQSRMGPITYGKGHMMINLHSFLTLFQMQGEVIGHSGSTGSYAFYYPLKDMYYVGDINQMNQVALPIRTIIKLASV